MADSDPIPVSRHVFLFSKVSKTNFFFSLEVGVSQTNEGRRWISGRLRAYVAVSGRERSLCHYVSPLCWCIEALYL